MTLLELLADDLLASTEVAADGAERRVLLWLDPQSQFARLSAHLEPVLADREVRLLRLGGGSGAGQLMLKLELLQLETDSEARAVVYLPGSGPEALEPRSNGRPPELWSVYEYRFKGTVWGRGARWKPGAVPEPPTLLSWLQRHRLKLADEKTRKALVAGGEDALLARYADRMRRMPPSQWPQPLRLSDVEDHLAGDPREALRGLLAAPANEVKSWGLERSTVLARIASEYGLECDGPAVEPESLADTFALDLALAEAWDAFERPDDFPFLSRLPGGTEHRTKQVAFMRDDVLSHSELGPRVLERLRRLEPQYQLGQWARQRVGQPGALPLLAEARWKAFLQRFDSAEAVGWKTARQLIREESEALQAAACAPWAALHGETHWPAAKDLDDLASLAEQTLEESSTTKSAAEMVSAYSVSWWRIDRLHLSLRAASSQSGLEAVRRVADRVYFEAVSMLADRFCALLEKEDGVWPPRGTHGVVGLRDQLWSHNEERRAVIITDACRWDVAQALREALGPECSLTPTLATLPTTTPFGMTALLPLGGALDLDLDRAQPVIRQGSPANLTTREGRKAFLRATLNAPHGPARVDFMDLEALLKGPAESIPNIPLLVVLDNTLDAQGHGGAEHLPELSQALVRGFKRAIDRLQEAGFRNVHLVTDHGFLLLPPDAIDNLGRPEVPQVQTFYRHHRWTALKQGAPTQEVMRVPLPLVPEVTLGFPRGVRTFMKAEPYLHGGISLQECVIPHLISQRVLPKTKVGLQLEVSTTQLTGGTVPVILRPRPAEAQPSLFGAEPLRVRVWVETVPEPGGNPQLVAEPGEVVLKADVQELRPPVYLLPEARLRAGQSLRVRSLDVDTGQELGSVDLTMMVDWD